MSNNFDKICRVCMQESPNLLHLFETISDNIANKLFYVTSYRAFTGDNLPEHICKDCLDNLEISYKFKKQYESSDNILKSYITSISTFEDITIKEEKIDDDEPEMTRIYSDYLIPEDQIKQEVTDLDDCEEILTNGTDNHYQYNSDHITENKILEFKEEKEEFSNVNEDKFNNIPNNDNISSLNFLEESNKSIEISNVVTLVQNQDVIDNSEINEENFKENLIYDEIRGNSSSSMECDSDDEEILNGSSFSRNSLYLCDLCDLVLQSKRELLLHKSTHPGIQLLQCTLCDKYFVDEDRLKNHILIHTGERQFSCKICKSLFRDKSLLLKHMNLHSNFRPYKCQICLKTFSKIELFNNHLRKHKGPRRFCCHICNRTFLLKLDLDGHLKTHTNPNIKPYQCSNCNKSFRLRNQLRKHVIINNKCNQFSCEICKKRFPTENFLKNHIKSHKPTHKIGKSF